jgi:hypothetical protein
VTSEGAAVNATQVADDGAMYCYRHPDRETYVRCGRCDRPICTSCAMQGPVGFRCKQCGTLANDPLTTIAPTHAVLGTAVAFAGGIVIGLITGGLGLFTIFVSFFAGGVISEAVIRITGYKRGPRILAIVFGGIAAGAIVGIGFATFVLFNQLAGLPAEGVTVSVVNVLIDQLPWLLVSVGSACAGAYTRLR